MGPEWRQRVGTYREGQASVTPTGVLRKRLETRAFSAGFKGPTEENLFHL